MSYTVTLTDGTVFATVPDGTINTDSSMTLVGKNYAGYGQFINDNIIRLLQTGANTTAPDAPLQGQLWYDQTTDTMKMYTGSAFKVISGATASSTAPSVSTIAGDLWYDSVNSQLNVYSGAAWILVGPAFTGNTGVSGAIVTTITDTNAVSHVAVQMYVSDAVVSIFSKDAAYTPATPPAGGGWTGGKLVQPGLTMAGAISGVTPLFQGTATTATTAGTVTTPAQPNITSVGTLTSLAVTGSISAGTVSATTFTGALSGTATNATTAVNVSGTVAVGNGGTGATTLAANNVLLGNSTSALQTVAPGTSGNVLTSNGTTWQSLVAPVAVPTGAINMWPNSTPPTGWLLCDGSDVSRTVYAALFAVCGTTFGSGSGSTFTLPNFTDRMPVGSGNNYGLGATGGSPNAIVVSHTHTFTGDALPTHLHGSGVASGGGGGSFYTATGSPEVNQINTSAVSAGTPAGTNSTEGSSATNANLPPYLGIRFIIKT